MLRRTGLLRPAAFLFSLILILLVMTSCFRKTITYASDLPSGPSGAQPNEGAASIASPEGENRPGEPSAPPVGEIFAAGVEGVLMNAARQYGAMTAAQYDLLFNPARLSGYSHTETTLHFVNSADVGDDTTYVIENIHDDETGDASMVIDKQSADGVAVRCGLYFYDNRMLVRKANDEKPAVLHALNTQVTQSYAALPAFERYNRVLSDTTAPKKTQDEWLAAVDTYLALIADTAKEPDYSAREETGMFAGVEMPCTAVTLKLMGERALTVTRALIALVGQDTSFKSCFNALYMPDGKTYGAAGLDGMLRDIDAMDDDARKEAVLTFILVVSGDLPVGMNVSLTSGDKTSELGLSFYEDGILRHNEIIFSGFDGSRVVLRDINAASGGYTYTETFLYDVTGPDGAAQEKMSAVVESTITDVGFEARTQFSHTREATGDTEAYSLSGSVVYSQERSGGAVNSTAAGTLEYLDGNESVTYNMDMTGVQTDGSFAITPPEYLPASGVTTADQQGLYEALGDFDWAGYIMAPMMTQRLAALTLLFS